MSSSPSLLTMAPAWLPHKTNYTALMPTNYNKSLVGAHSWMLRYHQQISGTNPEVCMQKPCIVQPDKYDSSPLKGFSYAMFSLYLP